MSAQSNETYRAREDDEVDILVTYSRREDDTIMFNSLARPVASVLRHFQWAAMIRGEGWLVPHGRLPLTLVALKSAGVTCVDTCAAFTGTDTPLPPPATLSRYAPQAECAECRTPYPAEYYTDGDTTCWRCSAPLRLVRPLILGDGESFDADKARAAYSDAKQAFEEALANRVSRVEATKQGEPNA